jgi:hypothetical protein
MSVLASIIKQKIFFNPNDKKHINVYKLFLREHRWGKHGCPFILEFPYLTIPDMIKDKMVHKLLGVKQESYKVNLDESRYQ